MLLLLNYRLYRVALLFEIQSPGPMIYIQQWGPFVTAKRTMLVLYSSGVFDSMKAMELMFLINFKTSCKSRATGRNIDIFEIDIFGRDNQKVIGYIGFSQAMELKKYLTWTFILKVNSETNFRCYFSPFIGKQINLTSRKHTYRWQTIISEYQGPGSCRGTVSCIMQAADCARLLCENILCCTFYYSSDMFRILLSIPTLSLNITLTDFYVISKNTLVVSLWKRYWFV